MLRYRRTRSESADRLAHREAYRSTNRAINESRWKHYAKKLTDTNGDSRGRWIVVRDLFHSDERLITKDVMENQTICEDFQRFFADKIVEIADKIKSITNSGSLPSPIDLAHSTPPSLRRLAIISDEEVHRAIHNIPPKPSTLDFIKDDDPQDLQRRLHAADRRT